MKRWICALLAAVLLPVGALAGETIEPEREVPSYVRRLLEVASEEVGYTEGEHGYTKYGEWAGDPYAQWCAEFLCWCVDQVDQRYGTSLLRNVYPLYSGSNTGRAWFIDQGRYITRNGFLQGWGYQWLPEGDSYLKNGDYIPQPGDWMFLTWTSGTDTDHVCMVEECTREEDGGVLIHVIEGNAPNTVQRNTYSLTDSRILGWGTVHDMADVYMGPGNKGEKVRQLQERLRYLGYLEDGGTEGTYGSGTQNAVRAFQQANGLRVTGRADMATQKLMRQQYEHLLRRDPEQWRIEDEEDEEDE